MARTRDDDLLIAAKMYEQGEFARAVAALDAFLAKHRSAAAYHLRSLCFRALGENQRALDDLNRSLDLEPNNAQGYRERAQLHFLAKRSDLAFVDNQLAEKYAASVEETELDEEECLAGADFEGDDEASEEDELFDRVCEAREEFFEDTFGVMPSDVLKLNNMMGVWPGGCLVQIDAKQLQQQPCVTATFGLTNPDMPATTRSEDVVHEERTEGDKLMRSTSMRLVARERVEVPAGLAGYGYEALVITSEQADWPTLFLSWFVTNEINHDAGWLKRVLHDGAVVVKCPLRDYPRLKLLLAKAADPLPDSYMLPNGMMHLLIATSITESEYAFAQKRGAVELLQSLLQSPSGQTSVIFRSSCI